MRVIFSMLSVFIFLSCSSSKEKDSDYYTLKVEFENVDGLETDAKVLFRGKKVGKVSEMHISKNNFIDVTMKFPDNFRIPVGSEFTVFASDIMGRRAINVEFSEAQEFYTRTDEIKGKRQGALGEKVDAEIHSMIQENLSDYFEIIENNDSFMVVRINKQQGKIDISQFIKSTNQQINK